jgi:hybrid cluster-associated redox disulfide protein
MSRLTKYSKKGQILDIRSRISDIKMVTKKITFAKLLEKYPQAAEILLGAGLHCFGCALAAEESLEQGARAHGLTDKEIDKLMEKINKGIKE